MTRLPVLLSLIAKVRDPDLRAALMLIANELSASGTEIGTVRGWAGDSDTVGQNDAIMMGQPLSAAQYSNLFKIMGYRWGGSGNTFFMPDTRGHGIPGIMNALIVRAK